MLAILLQFLSPVLAGAEPISSLLVKNARLADPAGTTQVETVNLLMKDGKLSLVTTDAVPEDAVSLVVDAAGGFILGRLDIGALSNFVVIDADPRSNFDVLLDTRKHGVLVLRNGEIKVNRLSSAETHVFDEITEEEIPRKWFAYSAPPIALGTTYFNTKRWNHYETGPVNINLFGALVLDRMSWVSQDGVSEEQVGDLSDYNEGEIRALRFGIYGTFNFDRPWIYTIAAASAAFDKGFDFDENERLRLFDARLDIPFYGGTTLAIGKQKEPISMDRLVSLIALPMQERAGVLDAMLPSRNIGIAFSGTGLDDRCAWAAGVFNPWLDEDVAIDEAPTQIVGRGTCVPLVNEDRSSMVHLGLGGRYTNAKQALAYQATPEFNQAPNFVSTGEFEADNGLLYDLELAWRWGPLLLNGEYIQNRIDAEELLDPVFAGYHLTASYVLTGEMRGYNPHNGLFRPVPVARPVNRGGWGAWEVSGRYSSLDLTDGTIEGGEMEIASLGLNWWLSETTSFGLNYRQVELTSEGETGVSHGAMARIVIMLE